MQKDKKNMKDLLVVLKNKTLIYNDFSFVL